MKRLVFFLACCCAAAGCDGRTEAPPDTPGPTTAPTAAPGTETAPLPAGSASVYATIKVVDLDGNALPNMAPIVTREPNAFDKPVASGAATDAGGQGSIRFSDTEHLYLRAWDPSLRYFPNNFFEILPGGNAIAETLEVQMVPAARLDVQLMLPGGEPAGDQAVGLMLFHPTRGPWWPAEATTDAGGAASFPHLPAGEYVLRFKVESGPRLEKEATALPPGSTVNLGVLTLQ